MPAENAITIVELKVAAVIFDPASRRFMECRPGTKIHAPSAAWAEKWIRANKASPVATSAPPPPAA